MERRYKRIRRPAIAALVTLGFASAVAAAAPTLCLSPFGDLKYKAAKLKTY